VTIDEGYIKYQSRWSPGPAVDADAALTLERSRRPLFAANLIGHYEDLNIGFGNISVRHTQPGQFLISGTQTGRVKQTSEQHYSLVTHYDIAKNEVSSTGPVQASSEAMTHAAIYELDEKIGAVVHVHSKTLWKKLLNRLPTTNCKIGYGTPEMAYEFRRLFEETNFSTEGLAVMGGHEEGLIAIGESLELATTRILSLYDAVAT
jgi:L-ribulose-5-phosphate 4-epimerase